jgi:hypothetical protein
MTRNQEIPSDMQVWGWRVPQNAPLDNLQSLMEQAPNHEAIDSLQQIAPTREAVRRAIDTLPAFDRYVIEASHFERLSIRTIAHRIGVSSSQAHRLLTRVNERLETALLNEHVIARKVDMQTQITDPTDWRAAATEALITIEQNAAYSPIHKTFAESLDQCVPYVTYGYDTSRGGVDILTVDECLLDVAITAWLALSEDARNRMLDLLCERQAKYGPKNILKFGTRGIIIRMSDKVERIANNSGDFADDSVEDAYMDLVGYAALHWMCANDIFELPLIEEA